MRPRLSNETRRLQEHTWWPLYEAAAGPKVIRVDAREFWVVEADVAVLDACSVKSGRG